jgi:hypothetical protein
MIDLPCKAGMRFLWCQDVHYHSLLTARHIDLLAGIIVLSEAHLSIFLKEHPFVPKEKFVLSQNGIDISLFQQHLDRDPYRIVYSSAPNRGLIHALSIFERLHLKEPK